MSVLSEYVTVEEAAKIINRKVSLIRTLCRNGKLSGAEKIGNSWVIPKETMLNYHSPKRGPKNNKSSKLSSVEFFQTIIDKTKEAEKNDKQ